MRDSFYNDPFYNAPSDFRLHSDYAFSGKEDDKPCKPDAKTVITSPKMMSLWKRSIDSNKALLLDELGLDPDALLKKVEEFDSVSQATEHSYPALIVSSEDGSGSSVQVFEEDQRDPYSEYDDYIDNDYDNESDDDEFYESDSIPMGSLPVDVIADKFGHD
ncbi:hypothetical protein C1H46_033097 [Malus baccata]|uniref:Uncharacterized protein n=1 Tax=Malus baccata TaxID=106549 RepID=A0A540L4W1_MALBA|nr:hypothetical protein C1H46_033097 [Malus baccata]